MNKKITIDQLRHAISMYPAEVKSEGNIFLQRALSEYKRVAIQSAPWRVNGSGGGIPADTGNLKEKHYTKIANLVGKFGVSPSQVRYAGFVHGGTRLMKARPWLEYARVNADSAVKKHYGILLDNLIKFIAT